jgi:hypothetical protein
MMSPRQHVCALGALELFSPFQLGAFTQDDRATFCQNGKPEVRMAATTAMGRS